MNNKDKGSLSQRLTIAKIIHDAENAEDMANCVADLMALGLSERHATVYAKAYRTAGLMAYAQENNIPLERLAEVIPFAAKDSEKDSPEGGKGGFRADFDQIDPSKQTLDDEIEEHGGHIPTEEEEEAEGETADEHQPEVADAIHHATELKNDEFADDDFDAPFLAGDEDEDEDDAVGGFDLGSGDAGAADGTVTIQVPADKADVIQRAIEEFLGGGVDESDDESATFGNEDGDDDDFSDADDTDDSNADFESDDTADEDEDEDSDSDEDTNVRRSGAFASVNRAPSTRKANTSMSNHNDRRRRIAQFDEKPKDRGLGRDTSYNGKPFGHNESTIGRNKDSWETMTLENSGGNTLAKDNAGLPKDGPDVPRYNKGKNDGPELPYTESSYEGSPEESDFYTADFPLLSADDIPSGEDRYNDTNPNKIPTQTGERPRKTTIASSESEPLVAERESAFVENALFDMLEAEGVPQNDIEKLSFAQGMQLLHAIRTAKKSNAENTTVTMPETDFDVDVELGKNAEAEDGEPLTAKKAKATILGLQKQLRAAKVENSRTKVAYSKLLQVALEGGIAPEEIDTVAEQWLGDNLSASNMSAYGDLLIKQARAANRRIAAAESHGYGNTREASVELSINPTFGASNGASHRQVAANDMSDMLASVFPSLEERFPEIEREERRSASRRRRD